MAHSGKPATSPAVKNALTTWEADIAALYALNDGAGTDVADSSGNSADATIAAGAGSATWATLAGHGAILKLAGGAKLSMPVAGEGGVTYADGELVFVWRPDADEAPEKIFAHSGTGLLGNSGALVLSYARAADGSGSLVGSIREGVNTRTVTVPVAAGYFDGTTLHCVRVRWGTGGFGVTLDDLTEETHETTQEVIVQETKAWTFGVTAAGGATSVTFSFIELLTASRSDEEYAKVLADGGYLDIREAPPLESIVPVYTATEDSISAALCTDRDLDDTLAVWIGAKELTDQDWASVSLSAEATGSTGIPEKLVATFDNSLGVEPYDAAWICGVGWSRTDDDEPQWISTAADYWSTAHALVTKTTVRTLPQDGSGTARIVFSSCSHHTPDRLAAGTDASVLRANQLLTNFAAFGPHLHIQNGDRYGATPFWTPTSLTGPADAFDLWKAYLPYTLGLLGCATVFGNGNWEIAAGLEHGATPPGTLTEQYIARWMMEAFGLFANNPTANMPDVSQLERMGGETADSNRYLPEPPYTDQFAMVVGPVTIIVANIEQSSHDAYETPYDFNSNFSDIADATFGATTLAWIESVVANATTPWIVFFPHRVPDGNTYARVGPGGFGQAGAEYPTLLADMIAAKPADSNLVVVISHDHCHDYGYYQGVPHLWVSSTHIDQGDEALALVGHGVGSRFYSNTRGGLRATFTDTSAVFEFVGVDTTSSTILNRVTLPDVTIERGLHLALTL